MVSELVSLPGLQHPCYQGEFSITSLAMSSKCCSLQGDRASSDSHTPVACSPTPRLAGPALLGFPGKVKSPLSLVLQQMRGRDDSSALMTTGSALLPASGGKGQGRGGHLTLATIWQTSGEANSLHSNPWDWFTPNPCNQGQLYCDNMAKFKASSTAYLRKSLKISNEKRRNKKEGKL